MSPIDFAAVRQTLRIAEVLDLLGWRPLTQRGQQARGRCPLHGSRAPRSRSFAVHLQRNLYHCFGCGAGGNALDLWAAHTRLSLYEAVLDLCQRLGRRVPWRRKETTMPP
jgi:DNA primase